MTPPPTDLPDITSPSTFAARAQAWVLWLNTFYTELAAIIGLTIPAGSAAAGTLTGDTMAANVLYSSLTTQGMNFAPITNSIGADVTLTTQNTYYDGPSVAQGTAGKWFVSGTVTVVDTGGAGSDLKAKLWDGTTLIASGDVTIPSGYVGSITLSGYLDTPAGNLRISVANASGATTGAILYNKSGLGKDSTITAIRIG